MNQEESVDGERTGPTISRAGSRSVRLHKISAGALSAGTGIAILAWYSYHLHAEESSAAQRASSASRGATASEMKLPAIVVQHQAASGARPRATATAADAPATPAPPLSRAGNAGVTPGGESSYHRISSAAAAAPVLVHPNAPVAEPPAVGDAVPGLLPIGSSAALEVLQAVGRRPDTSATAERASVVDATLLPDRRWLLPRASFLDCTLETAIDSTLAGPATCVLAVDIYGADGRIVLMERGTRLIGEVRSEARAGQNRVAVLWNEARTPSGVQLTLSSPGTDALGRTGVPGAVDRHTGERFGAAVLLSFIDAAVSAISGREQSKGAVIYNAQGSRDVATEALRNSVGIPPTIRVPQGARLQVIVAADVNFRGVYRLATRETG